VPEQIHHGHSAKMVRTTLQPFTVSQLCERVRSLICVKFIAAIVLVSRSHMGMSTLSIWWLYTVSQPRSLYVMQPCKATMLASFASVLASATKSFE
jgi:hypothetical protein